ncbi:hypothetical protein DW1_0727 [Proteiniborus sp. DW1]|uniref:hypothetical protein n=1 Tax=Proteiniborus sp. DW1 TaxID=1889883 RepID=UPI00092DFE81|nr:hypothetical protein [Proteiniborus sp. DW1]SCG82335.1 hypothetical protein DW1_0727 [Proteiniborus sp. DW1]
MANDKQLTIYDFIEKAKQVDTREIPRNIKLKRGQSWCPYCNNIVIFIKDKRLKVRKCPICGISENDFWVKKVNRKNSGG